MIKPMTEDDATFTMGAICSSIAAMRTLLKRQQDAMRLRSLNDNVPGEGLTSAQFKVELESIAIAEEANLNAITRDAAALAVGVTGALFRAVEALETIAENTGPGIGR